MRESVHGRAESGESGWCHQRGSGAKFDQRDAEPDGEQAGEEVGPNVGEGKKGLVVEEEAGGVPAEGGEGGEAAEEADDDSVAEGGDEEQFGPVWLNGGVGREPLEELTYHPNQQTAGQVDEEGGEREVLAGGVREGEAHAIAGEGTEGAAEGDKEGVTHGRSQLSGVRSQGDRLKPGLRLRKIRHNMIDGKCLCK